jgi:transcription initiation factor IIE alpha subunit
MDQGAQGTAAQNCGTQGVDTSLCPKCKRYVTQLDNSDPISDIEKVGNMKKKQLEGNIDEINKIRIRKANFVVSEEL